MDKIRVFTDNLYTFIHQVPFSRGLTHMFILPHYEFLRRQNLSCQDNNWATNMSAGHKRLKRKWYIFTILIFYNVAQFVHRCICNIKIKFFKLLVFCIFPTWEKKFPLLLRKFLQMQQFYSFSLFYCHLHLPP